MKFTIIILFLISVKSNLFAADNLKMSFRVSMENPAQGVYQVSLKCTGLAAGQNDFKIPVWMPGYYQIMNYADDFQKLSFKDAKGKAVKWERANHNTWRIYNGSVSELAVSYQVKTKRSFVATNYLAEDRGFIAPTGLFLHVDGKLNTPVTVTLNPYSDWKKVATGLEKVKGKAFTFTAPNFDVLYDSPILIGKLEELPSFLVAGVPHYFIGYKLGDFNKQEFINDLQKVVEKAVEVIGEVPFKDYTFIGIGPGGGGIEHLNSTAIAFSGGKELNSREGRKRMLSFLGHEYFHHYNAKRIRPVELGPFDYDNGSRTNMLWVAEGVTSYYDKMLLRRAGLESSEEILHDFENAIAAYESSPGRNFQSVSQASFDTWSDGPFGRVGDEVNKTISYYQKGPVMAMMLDFKIRHETKNKKTLDDVMRSLYFDYYKKLGRGYTEDELKLVCEEVAGVNLDEFFSYIYSLKTPDYKKYFNYAGLDIDLSAKLVPGSWHGIEAALKDGKLVINRVDWESPAWQEGIRRNDIITQINGEKASLDLFNSIALTSKPNDIMRLFRAKDGKEVSIPVILAQEKKVSYKISRNAVTDDLQQVILKDWLKE